MGMALVRERAVTRLAATTLVVVSLAACRLDQSQGSAAAEDSRSTNASVAMQVAGPITDAEAIRFLEQASFGADDASISAVRARGFAGWIADQIAMPAPRLPTPDPITGNYDAICRDRYAGANDTIGSCLRDFYTSFPVQTGFFRRALGAPEQLRLRVAFALSQILVTSGADLKEAYAVAAYQQLLLDGAFGNYGALLKEVTLSPPMGKYLHLAGSAKADPARGTQPNENYPRELMQLFSIGPVLLNEDGSAKLDANGRPIPSYDQTTIKETARALSGWTHPTRPGYRVGQDYPITMLGSMVPAAGAHDTGAKTLVGGRALAAGQSIEADLDGVIDALMRHPNVGPFVAKRLIQFLVTGQPSAAYVARVARVFNDNGQNVKGDLAATVRAILLDPEARTAPTASTVGRVREPVLFMTQLLRSLGARSDGVWLAAWSRTLGQPPFDAPSVFNFFPMEYRIPGTQTNAPQLRTLEPGALLARSNFLNELLFTVAPSARQSHILFSDGDLRAATGTELDLGRWEALTEEPVKLVEALAARLFALPISAGLKQAVATAAGKLTAPRERVALTIYLLASSPEYQVAK